MSVPVFGHKTSDVTPDAFGFVDQTGVALSTLTTSAPVVIAGIDAAAVITVTGGAYSINGGAFTASNGMVVAGDLIRAQHTSSSLSLTAVNTIVNVGRIVDTFTSTTQSAVNQPPVWSGATTYPLLIGTSFTLNLDTLATDPESQPITYSLVGGSYPAGIGPSGARNQTVSGTPTTVQTALPLIRANDGFGGTADRQFSFGVTSPAPGIPQNLIITGFTSNSISMAWDAVASVPNLGYRVQVSTNGGTSWSYLATFAGSPVYVDSGLSGGMTRYYRVTACTLIAAVVTNETAPSNVVNATTFSFTVPDIVFIFGTASDASLTSYFTIASGEAFVSIAVTTGALPTGVTLVQNAGAPYFHYDGVGAITTVTGLQLTVTSAAVAANVTSFALTSTVGGTLLPFTIGHAFKQGDIPTGQYVSSDLTTFQADVRNRWSDDSVKYAVLSGRKTLTANVASMCLLGRTSTVPTGTNLTEANLIGAAPTASIALSGFGTVTLTSLMGTAALVRTIAGVQMSEFHYRAAVGSDAHLTAWFYVRLYTGNHIEIETCVENGYLNVAGPTVKTYIPTLTINGTVRYNNGGAALTHKHHNRWAMPFWYGTDPQITPAHDTTYLRSTKQVPNYGNMTISAAKLNSLTQTIVPFQLAGYHSPMGDTGFAESIGLLNNWDAIYLVTGDSRAYKSVIANAYAAGRYEVHFRDETTQRPPRVMSYVHLGYAGATDGALLPVESGGVTDGWDIPHHPPIAYLAYLVSGRWYFMEELQMVAAANLFFQRDAFSNNGTRWGSATSLHTVFSTISGSATNRGTGWALRTLAYAINVSPDSDTGIRNDLIAHYQDNIDYYYLNYAAPGVGNALGVFFSYDNYEGNGHWAQAIWQEHYICESLAIGSDILRGHLAAQSQTRLDDVLAYKYKVSVGMAGGSGGSGWCYLYQGPYFVRTSATDNGGGYAGIALFNAAAYSDWGACFADQSGTGTGIPVNPSCPINGVLQGSGAGAPDQAASGYWGYMLAPLSYAKDQGATGASAAYTLTTGASNWSTVVNALTTANTPMWYILPRT